MDDAVLRKAQLTQLEILKRFRDVCDAHGLTYILGDGTLLGAIRHDGFIPWDDDVDINMPREDYEAFLHYSDEMGEDYCLQTWKNDKEYAMPFAKIRMKGTVYREANSEKMQNNGIYIDVFPCDRFDQMAGYNKIRFRALNLIRLAMTIQSPVYKNFFSSMNLRKRVFVLASHMMPRACLIGMYELLAKCQNKRCAGFKYYEHEGAYPVGDITIAAECFEKRMMHVFEDDQFAIPLNYDLYLKTLYGDYMVPPPENERGNRHGILEVRFRDETM